MIALAFAALAMQNAAPATGADWVKNSMAAVTRYWEYTAALRDNGLDFLGARYRPGTYAAVYFRDLNGSPFGLCVAALAACQAYYTLPDGVVTHTTWLRMRPREKPIAAIRRFSKRGFADQDDLDNSAEAKKRRPSGARRLCRLRLDLWS